MNLIMGLVGMATLILIAVLFSSNRKAIKIRTVGGAFAIQALTIPSYERGVARLLRYDRHP